MTPTLNTLITQAYLVGLESNHQFERLPWDLCQRLVWYGLDDDPEDPDDRPGDGIGVLCLLLGVANWGVDLAGWVGFDGSSEVKADPAAREWAGVPAKSGKHFARGSRLQAFGGWNIGDFDVSALLAAYERFGWPAGGLHTGWYTDTKGRALAFDTIRKRGGRAWDLWLDWATQLYETDARIAKAGGAPPAATWAVKYWLREFWDPAWNAAEINRTRRGEPRVDVPWVVDSACVGARFRNSAKGAAEPHLGKPASEIADAYVAYKKAKRGQKSADRTKRQIAYSYRPGRIVEAVMMEAL